MTADVTVIIPTHNRRALLERTLTSVLAQEGVSLEVVVVNDGGTDGTVEWVARHDDPRVTLVNHPEPRGVAAARNSGIERASTPWLAFVDDDDLWSPLKLQCQLAALAAEPAAGWSCTGSVDIDSDLRLTRWDQPPDRRDLADSQLRENAIPGGGSGVVASREATRAIGGFDEALSNIADWDFYIRLALHCEVAPVFRPHLGYYVHPQGMAHDVATAAREYRYLDVKFAAERRRRGVQLNESGWTLYLAGLAYNGGQRLTGMRLHAQLVVQHHRWRSLRSLGMGLAPKWLRQARARRPGPELPPGWAAEATGWLAAYRNPVAA